MVYSKGIVDRIVSYSYSFWVFLSLKRDQKSWGKTGRGGIGDDYDGLLMTINTRLWMGDIE